MISWSKGARELMAAPKKYPDELRERAVRLVRESGRPIAHVAEDLGIHREALGSGCARTRPTAGSATTG
jgi:transposase